MLERKDYDVVRARKFEVVDEEDRVRAAIGPGPTGETGVQLYGRDGAIRVELSVDESSTVFSLRDPSGRDMATLAVGEEGPSTISLTHSGDQDESWAIALAGDDPNEPGLQRCSLLLTQGQRPRLVLTLMGEDNEPCILMREGESLVRVVP